MTTIVKPGLDVDVIAVPATVIVCGATECERPATEMFHHSLCGGGNPACPSHTASARQFMRNVRDDGEYAIHLDCDDLITPTNHSFRPI